MGKRSDRRTFRMRRRRAGLALLVSLAVVVLGVVLFSGEDPDGLEVSPMGTAEETPVERMESPSVAGAPEAAAERENEPGSALLAAEDEDRKTAAERERVKQRAERRAEQKAEARAEAREAAEKEQASKPAKPAEPPDPPTNDLWMSIPALGLYDNYVSNSNDPAALDVGAAKTAQSAFPWQDNANTYISAHRLGYPGTASDHQFYNLPLLAEGDVIYLGDANGTTYTYEVTGFKEVTPDQTWITGPQAGRDMVSLQTCIEDYGDYWTMGPNWYVRYVVQADRVSVDPAV
ncbi:MAG: sortase [Rubrobacter sp.]